ncbi:hypothetical protein Tcan_05846 [Toxocara canis]|uniref:Uncharacterized protein n=1 Tax=Toxocara canis TaxID=6265 RepID=A0A0B2VVQ2_TOXCA|nr:hypothetical protein Tcan_05846 [Toxocara canis]
MLPSTFCMVTCVFFSFCAILVDSDRTQCGGVKSTTTTRWLDTYICPSPKHNPLQNRCCDPPEFGCCTEATFFEKHTTAVISILLIIILVASTLLMLVCLCWEKCILHKAIRKRPSLDYITQPEEVEHLQATSIPCEASTNIRVYEVNADIIYQQNKELV